ncbi:O-antigen ligase family protein [Micromonospora sp. NPDC051925]|uniref:O-antigen ligase family protein n=1 Tax=Micromonospora sp. NPDC051925 TaxID=3364288 RepID=UPI0037CC198E
MLSRDRMATAVQRAVALRRSDSAISDRVATGGVAVLLSLAWARVTFPPLLDVLANGRPVFNSPVDSMPATGRVLGDTITASVIGLSLLLAGYGLRRRRARRPGELVVVLAPLCALHLAGLVNGEHPGPVALALPAAVLAIWALRPGTHALATIGVLGAVTAAGALLLAALRPDLALLTGAGLGAKSWAVGGLLTGPYPHSNVLGLMLALSLPFVFSLRHAWSRRAALVTILVVLVWTGSRTSQLAALVALLTWGLLHPRVAGRAAVGWRPSVLVGVPAAAGLALTVFSPLLVTDPTMFTKRGRIWRALLSRWAERPLIGHGPGYFERRPELAEALGGRYTHGHNVLVHLLAVGGLLTLVLFAVLLGLVWRRSTLLAGLGAPAPALFLISLVWISWLEASHLAVTLAGFLTWLPLCLIMWAGPPGGHDRVRTPARPEDSWRPGVADSRW